MKRWTLFVAGLLAAFALGWLLHKPGGAPSSPAPKLNSVQTIAARALAELLGYYQRKDLQLTARNRALFDSLGHYRKLSGELLAAQQQAETTFVTRDTGITRDSVTRLCYAVVRLCEIRADSAIAQRDRYAKALDAQLGLQPHRWSISLTGGATRIFLPKPALGIGATLGVSFRLW